MFIEKMYNIKKSSVVNCIFISIDILMPMLLLY